MSACILGVGDCVKLGTNASHRTCHDSVLTLRTRPLAHVRSLPEHVPEWTHTHARVALGVGKGFILILEG